MTSACIHCGNLGPNDDAGGGDEEAALDKMISEYFRRTAHCALAERGIVEALDDAADVRDDLRSRIDTRLHVIISERDAAVRRLDALTLPGAERRERIATACLAGLMANADPQTCHAQQADLVGWSVRAADALIAALDGTVKP